MVFFKTLGDSSLQPKQKTTDTCVDMFQIRLEEVSVKQPLLTLSASSQEVHDLMKLSKSIHSVVLPYSAGNKHERVVVYDQEVEKNQKEKGSGRYLGGKFHEVPNELGQRYPLA